MGLLVEIHPTYMKIWNFKKTFIRKTITYLTHFIKCVIILTKYFLKYILKHLLVYLVNKIPLQIKRKSINIIYNYPKLFFFSKKFRSWVINAESLNQVLQTDFIVYFFIKNVLLSILKISLEDTYARSIILNEIRLNRFVRTELNKILKELNLSKKIERSTFLLYRNENLELSEAEEEIYRDLQITTTEA